MFLWDNRLFVETTTCFLCRLNSIKTQHKQIVMTAVAVIIAWKLLGFLLLLLKGTITSTTVAVYHCPCTPAGYIYISYIHVFTGAKSGSQTKHISLALTKWYRFFLGGNMAILKKVGRASLLLVLANKWSFVRFAFIIAGSLIVFYIVFDTWWLHGIHDRRYGWCITTKKVII